MAKLAALAAVAALAARGVAGDACYDKQVPVRSLQSSRVPELMDFDEWALKFGKTYESSEHRASKQAAFEGNLALIKAHNKEHDAGRVTFRLGVNHLADLTQAEYADSLSPMKRDAKRLSDVKLFNEAQVAAAKGDNVDWREEGAVTPVKNQQQCGSCWAFSTTGSTEGAFFLATGELRSFSEQQLVDCSAPEGNMGCNGGLMDYGFQYILDNKGIDSEDDYAYTAVTGTCDATKAANVAGTIDSFTDVQSNSEDQLAAAILTQPISVAIEADQSAFQLYKSGVFNSSCGTQLDHGVLAVGLTDDAYIVKNSWGETWGQDGYIMMARNVGSSGICGIAAQASYPVKAKGPAPPAPSPTPGPTPGPSPPPAQSCGCTPQGESTCGMFGLTCCCQNTTVVTCTQTPLPAGQCCCDSNECGAKVEKPLIGGWVPEFLKNKGVRKAIHN